MRLLSSVLCLLLLLIGCNQNVPIVDDNIELVSSNPSEDIVEEYPANKQGSDIEDFAKEPFFCFEIPDLSGYSNDRLPLAEQEKWCVNGGAWTQITETKQFVMNDKTSFKIAEAVALVAADNNFNLDYDSFVPFSNVTEANPKELLFAAILQTPKIALKTIYDELNNVTVDGPENNAVVRIVSEAGNTNGFAITEIYYADDVEKTFHYLFGNDVVFEPQNIESQRFRYIPEAEIFVTDLETTSKIVYPQILSYQENGEIYQVELVLTYVWEYYPGDEYIIEYEVFDKNRPGMTISIAENNVDRLQEQPKYIYTLEKGMDGNFIVKGIEY